MQQSLHLKMRGLLLHHQISWRDRVDGVLVPFLLQLVPGVTYPNQKNKTERYTSDSLCLPLAMKVKCQ